MSTAMTFSGKIEGTERKVYINVLDQEEGKQGFPAYLNEVVDGQRQPGHRVSLFLNGNDDNKWLTLSAPLRVKSEDGSYATIPRTNSEGSYVNDKGEVVEKADQAARVFEYLTYKDPAANDEDRIVYGTIANINVKNEKQDGSPTAFTMLNTKFYDDQDALDIARLTYELKQLEEGTDERAKVEQELSTMRRERGTWMTLFIDSGHENLRNLGFDIRAREQDGPAPK